MSFVLSIVYSQALQKIPDVEVPLPAKDKLGFDQVLAVRMKPLLWCAIEYFSICVDLLGCSLIFFIIVSKLFI